MTTRSRGHVTLVKMAKKWSDSVGNMFFVFLDRENHTLDTKIALLSHQLPEISSDDHNLT
jgi:hypothetical protein